METGMQSITESAVRARANARGHYVCKSRDRSTHFNNCGDYQLVEAYRNLVVLGVRFDASLQDISDYLADLDQEGKAA
jgi:hypothetical protein